ncbi:MAG TPA: MXAN_2562 family outer membrane beta-barrel protein [Polyangia bacterium]|nr:MXAN_2562 family outer membrane beta-barrel protein [Polyangia bacterium]
MLGSARADAQTATPVSLSATDFTLTLSRVDASGNATVLDADALATYFSLARCACPTNVVATLTLDSAAADSLSSHTIDAQLELGDDCDLATATAPCTSVGPTLTFSSTNGASMQSLQTSAIFAAAGRSSCAAASTSSTRLWAVVRLDGERLASEPSLPLTLGGAGPTAPTGVTTVGADEGLLVSWTSAGDASTLQGYQVLCSPGAATAQAASYDTCPAAQPDGGTGPFASLDPTLLCSGLVPVGTSSVRVHGLVNGQSYQIAVVAVGIDGTPSAPSVPADGTPGPTYGFQDVYQQQGGTAQPGCAVAGGSRAPAGALAALAVALALVLARRRRRRTSLLVLAAVMLPCARAKADPGATPAFPQWLTATQEPAPVASPQAWNVELRFGPYRPDVDAEFSARGSAAHPYADVFGTSNRLMTQLEIDRQVLRRLGGTWAIGVGVGYFRATGAALAADLKTPSGDQTGLRLIPLSAALVYRAETLRERYGSPLVPYAKLGLDCTLWQMSDTSKPSADGRTLGWHAALGVSLDLSVLDREAAHTMDRESGINETALFFEGARYSIDGFGSSTALHVGDTTWSAGLMLAF